MIEFASSRVIEGLTSFQQLLADKNTNDVFDLLMFSVGLLFLFLWRHYRRNRDATLNRRTIGLVIGGWGSRGKSGTERLKAALFNALGHSLISKTTGCEPVLLHGTRFGKLEEIPLHRPFQKTTIWEQLEVVQLAKDLEVDAFLWECMGLEPEYVQIMQREWMKDDISTITNTYPDHEDIQGPSGLDVARSIAHFVGEGQLLTAEELMLPILRQRCQSLGSQVTGIDLRELNALTNDVMARFPYAEHPHNIALVLALARQLGIHRDFALKEMADRVKPDIGVLKTYPSAILPNCTLTFTNGFSANEKFACVSNWKRLGFEQMTLEAEPRTWLTVLINNREDRVFRSQVFASIVVDDLSVDAFYVVGTNLDGFKRAYLSCVEAFLKDLDVRSWDSFRRTFASMRERLRIPNSLDQLRARLGTSLPGEALEAHEQALVESFHQWDELGRGCEDELAALAPRLIQLSRNAYHRKMVIVSAELQSDIDRLIAFIAAQTPRLMQHKMQGIQNIKGVGLRWLEAWEEYEQLHRALLPLGEQTRERALDYLSSPLRERPLCHMLLQQLHLRHELDAAQTAQVDGEKSFSEAPASPGSTWGRGARFVLNSLAEPTKEYRKTKLIRRIYKNFGSRLLDAPHARQEIRAIQEM